MVCCIYFLCIVKVFILFNVDLFEINSQSHFSNCHGFFCSLITNMAQQEDTYFEDLLEIAPYVDDFLRLSSDEESETESGKLLKSKYRLHENFPATNMFVCYYRSPSPHLSRLE